MGNLALILSVAGVVVPIILTISGCIAANMRRREDKAVEMALQKKQLNDIEKKIERLPCQPNTERIAKLESAVSQLPKWLEQNEKLINVLEQQAKMLAARQQ